MRRMGQRIPKTDMSVGDVYVEEDGTAFLVLQDGGSRIFCMNKPEEILVMEQDDMVVRYLGRIDYILETMDKMALM